MFNFGVIATVLVISVLLIISGIKILREYERAVILRLGPWDYVCHSIG